MKLNARRGSPEEDVAPMDLERPLHYRREEEIDQSKGGCVDVCAPGFEGLMVKVSRKLGC